MGAVENIKEVADLVKKFNDIELNRRILTLENEVLDLSREKRRAEEKVEELQRSLKFKGELVFREPFYWLQGDNTPYCPACWEDKQKVVHITYSHANSHGQYWQCPNCKTDYTTHGIHGRY
jgi:hypothetical protein